MVIPDEPALAGWGSEQFTETMVLSPSTPTGTKLFWDAAMNDKRLSITARRGPVPSKS
jgi:hypothetical protein